MIGTSGLHRRQ
jgi:hypothetical protein